MSQRRSRFHARVAALVAAVAYAGALAVLLRAPDADIVEPLFLLASLGLAFPALAWALTRRPRTTTPSLSRPPSRPGGPLLYLALFSVLVLGWGFGAIAAQWPGEPAQSIAKTLVKLATMVALPALLFLRDDRRRPRFGNARLWMIFAAMALALLGFQAMFGRGLITLRELAPDAATLAWAIPLCWLWQVLEAGLCEEVLFRRMLQQHLADATSSSTAAVLWASLLFGLAHAPGLYLRGAHLMEGVATATPLWAAAYSIAIIAPAGVVFGVLWARTRSLWLVVLLHGTMDLLPQLAPFIRTWHG
ncbi:MAG: lysostaphin resistance A-like protein [Lysobacteraceae bacterium]